MDFFGSVELVVALWILSATILLIFMVRRGHDPLRWALATFILGPVAWLLAVVARQRATATPGTVLHPGARWRGPMNVVVGVDGSQESAEALDGALDMFASNIAQMTLAYVINFEAADPMSLKPDKGLAHQTLLALGKRVEARLGAMPTTIVLAGAPADALVTYAVGIAADVIVVGAHGRGDSDWMLGSVAAHLVKQDTVRAMVLGRTAGQSNDEAPSSDGPGATPD